MKDYFSPLGVKYEASNHQVWPSLPICQYLVGTPWNDTALAAVSSTRPSSIRVVRHDGEIKDNGSMWRVTVFLDHLGLISNVEQEVVVDAPEGVANGHEFCRRLEKYPHWPADSF